MSLFHLNMAWQVTAISVADTACGGPCLPVEIDQLQKALSNALTSIRRHFCIVSVVFDKFELIFPFLSRLRCRILW